MQITTTRVIKSVEDSTQDYQSFNPEKGNPPSLQTLAFPSASRSNNSTTRATVKIKGSEDPG
jgi:hypothetical protein